MTVHAIRWFGGGKCLVEDESTGETFTAARVLPGERVHLRRYERAGRRVPVADEVLVPSPHRVTPTCPEFERCTGCDLLHVSEAEEARYKALTIREVLERFAGVVLDPSVGDVVHVGNAPRGDHRVRARLTCDWDAPALALGLRGFDGQVVNIPHCPANAPVLRATLQRLHAVFSAHPCPAIRALEVVTSGANSVVTIVPQDADFKPLSGIDTDTIADAAARFAAVPGVVAVARETADAPELLHGVWPDQHAVGDMRLAPAPGAWTQPTPHRADGLYAWVQSLGAHTNARMLDATCGTGGLTFAVAPQAASVLGVDANWAAVVSATESAARLEHAGAIRPNSVAFRGGKIETVSARLLAEGAEFDFTIVNPMRRSIGEECMQTLAALTQGPILYLAPAPRAGAEDVGALVRAGYAVQQVAAIHLHPGTSKVMMGVLLGRS